MGLSPFGILSLLLVFSVSVQGWDDEECYYPCEYGSPETGHICNAEENRFIPCELVQPYWITEDADVEYQNQTFTFWTDSDWDCQGRCNDRGIWGYQCKITMSYMGRCSKDNLRFDPSWTEYMAKVAVAKKTYGVMRMKPGKTRVLFDIDRDDDTAYDDVMQYLDQHPKSFYLKTNYTPCAVKEIRTIYVPGYNERKEANLMISFRAEMDLSTVSRIYDYLNPDFCKEFPENFNFNWCNGLFSTHKHSLGEVLRYIKFPRKYTAEDNRAVHAFYQEFNGKMISEGFFTFENFPSVKASFVFFKLSFLFNNQTKYPQYRDNPKYKNIMIIHRYRDEVLK